MRDLGVSGVDKAEGPAMHNPEGPGADNPEGPVTDNLEGPGLARLEGPALEELGAEMDFGFPTFAWPVVSSGSAKMFGLTGGVREDGSCWGGGRLSPAQSWC